jgi:hypothetical protein
MPGITQLEFRALRLTDHQKRFLADAMEEVVRAEALGRPQACLHALQNGLLALLAPPMPDSADPVRQLGMCAALAAAVGEVFPLGEDDPAGSGSDR